MQKKDGFIYEGRGEAFSYAIITFVSLVIPNAIFFQTSNNVIILLLTLFVSSLSLLRESVVLYKYKKPKKIFWIKRAVCVILSLFVAIYSLTCLFLITSNREIANNRELILNNLRITNLIAFTALVVPSLVISLLEGIWYSFFDFKNNTTNEKIEIVHSNTTIV